MVKFMNPFVQQRDMNGTVGGKKPNVNNQHVHQLFAHLGRPVERIVVQRQRCRGTSKPTVFLRVPRWQRDEPRHEDQVEGRHAECLKKLLGRKKRFGVLRFPRGCGEAAVDTSTGSHHKVVPAQSPQRNQVERVVGVGIVHRRADGGGQGGIENGGEEGVHGSVWRESVVALHVVVGEDDKIGDYECDGQLKDKSQLAADHGAVKGGHGLREVRPRN